MGKKNKTPFTKINKWLILVVATIVMMVDFALLFSLGAIYIDVMETYKADRATAAVVQSLMTGVALGFGVFSGALITTFGLPIVTMIASVLVPFGFISSFFISNIHILYITIGIIAAIGTSMAHVSSVTVAGRVFKGRHQLMSITILNTAVGIASLGYPYLLSWLTEKFGLSGTFLVLGGITSNTFLLFIVCFINREALGDRHFEESKTSANDENANTTPSTTTSANPYEEYLNNIIDEGRDDKGIVLKTCKKEGTINSSFIEDKYGTELKLNNQDTKRKAYSNDRIEVKNLETSICEKENIPKMPSKLDKMQSYEIKEVIQKNDDSDAAISSNAVYEDVPRDKNKCEESEKKTSIGASSWSIDSKSRIKRQLRNIHVLFKELMTRPYVCLVLAFAFGNISLNGYLGVKIDIALWKGLNASEGLTSFLVFNCSNIVSRFVPGLLKERKGINSFFYPMFSAVSGFIGQLLIYFSRHISIYMVGVCFCGIAFGGIVSSSINATVRIVRLELVPIAVGFLISVNGVLIVGVGPLFGAIRDLSGSYGSVIITICIAQAIAAMFYLAAMVLRKRTKENSIELEITEPTTQTTKL